MAKRARLQPHIVIEDLEMLVVMPYNRSAQEQLKATIPDNERKFDLQNKFWKVAVTEYNYNAAVNVITTCFGAPPMVFSKGKNLRDVFARSIDKTSLYTILRVSEKATPEQIKSAYRQRVATVHPDRGGSTELFHVVQRAYETLRDPRQRKKYDVARELVRKAKEEEEDDDWYSRPFPYGQSTVNTPTPPAPTSVTTPFGKFNVGDHVSLVGTNTLETYLIDGIDHNMTDVLVSHTVFNPNASGVLRVQASDLRQVTLGLPDQGTILWYLDGTHGFTLGGGRPVKLLHKPKDLQDDLHCVVAPFKATSVSLVLSRSKVRPLSNTEAQQRKGLPAKHFFQGDFVMWKGIEKMIFVKKVGDTEDCVVDVISRRFLGRQSNLQIVKFNELDFYIPTP